MQCLKRAAICCGGSSHNPGLVGSPRIGRARKRLQDCRSIEDFDEREFLSQKEIADRVVAALSAKRSFWEFIFGGEPDLQDGDELALPSELVPVLRHGSNEYIDLKMPIDFRQAESLRAHYERKGGGAKPVSDEDALALLAEFRQRYLELHPSPVAELKLAKGARVVVVGDTHGQLQDVLYLFRVHGPPSAGNVYLFNGDIADRGRDACEIYFLTMAYFLAEPTSILINRGNHEDVHMHFPSADEGGGFFDEVMTKFNQVVYKAFVDMMLVLHLVTVIEDMVFVVHGGLSGRGKVSLDLIRSIPHTTNTCPPFDSLDQRDQLWFDLLWSDPTDSDGSRPSSRGAGFLFGPDRTRTFLRDNRPLNMIIRSHQLPSNGWGVEKCHDDQVVTLFSASNYCGHCGNKGAVIVLDGDRFPEYTVHDYYAPTLDIIHHLVADDEPTEKWVQTGESLYLSASEVVDHVLSMKQLSRIKVAIVEKKPEIWAKFLTVADGRSSVDFPLWSKLLRDVIGPDWDFKHVWNDLRVGKADGTVDFLDFLKRFTVVLTNDEYISFKLRSISNVYQRIVQRSPQLKDAFALFDLDGDGEVTMAEMQKALQPLIDDGVMTSSQLDGFVRGVFKSGGAKDATRTEAVPIVEFLGRFTMMYKHARDVMQEEAITKEQRLLAEAMFKVAHLIVALCPTTITSSSKDCSIPQHITGVEVKVDAEGRGKVGGTDKVPRRSSTKVKATNLSRLFVSMDRSRDGFVSHDEFVAGLKSLPGIESIRLSNGERITELRMQQLAEMADADGNGLISILEFLEALEVDDVGGGQSLADDLSDRILAVMLRHRSAIRMGALCFDRDATGVLRAVEFRRVLQALNDAIEASGQHWTDNQINDLCDALAFENEDGVSKIAYETVFVSLEVVDSEQPGYGVRLARPTRNQCSSKYFKNKKKKKL